MLKYLKEYWPLLLALLPVLFMRDFSPATELRYVSMGTEMLRTHNFFCPTWQEEPYPYVMPLYIWLIAGLKFVFGHHYMVTIAGLFSLLPALCILAVMNRWVERFDTRSLRLCDGSQSRMLASMMLCTCGLMLGQSFFVGMDMLYALWIVLALYTFWRLVSRTGAYGPSPDRRHFVHLQWHMGLYVFLAIFTKGPQGGIILMACTTIYLLCSHQLREWLRVWSWRTWLVILTLSALWTYGTYREGGRQYLEMQIMQHPLAQLLHAPSHDRPWYYYLASLWVDTLPWGPLCLVVLIASFVRRIRRRLFRWPKVFDSSLQNFFVSTFLVILGYYSICSYKLDVNMLPAYPFLVYAGVMQLGQWRWPLRWHWPIMWVCRGVLLAVFIGGCMCPWLNINAGCYGRVCYHANRLSRELHTEPGLTYVYRLRRVKGMDAYLHHDPVEASVEDIAAGKLRNTLMIMKEYRLDDLCRQLDALNVPADCRGQVIDELGAYVILYFPPQESTPR